MLAQILNTYMYSIIEAHKGAAKNLSDYGKEKLQYRGADNHGSL